MKGSTHCTTLSSVEEEEEEEDEGRQDTHTSGQFAMQIEARSLPPVLRRKEKEKKLQHQTQAETEEKPKK